MPMNRLIRQYNKFREYFIEKDMKQSLLAMDLVDKYHIGLRRGGDPESSHLYEVAGKVLSLLEGRVSYYELDCAVAASFLHDLVEDYSDLYSEKQLRIDFEERTANVVMNVCKWEGFEKIERDYEIYFEKILTDVLSVFVKVSDRVHNLSTCVEGMSKKRILQYFVETEKYFYPMISRAKKIDPNLYMALTSVKQDLKYRIKITQLILDK